MTIGERLAVVKFDLIKLALNKKFNIDEYKELKRNLIIVDQLMKQNKENNLINENNIVSVEDYITSKKGR